LLDSVKNPRASFAELAPVFQIQVPDGGMKAIHCLADAIDTGIGEADTL
jgi:hypothetical protein